MRKMAKSNGTIQLWHRGKSGLARPRSVVQFLSPPNARPIVTKVGIGKES